MLRVITGVPGSGKSLYAVKCLLEAKDRGEYLITNIDGFKYADEFIDEHTQEGLINFILGRDWEEFAKTLGNRKIYVVIDEAQRVYASTGMVRKTQQEMFYFLEYHRHYGANVDLVTQSHRSLNSRVMGLLNEIVQVSKVSGVTGKQRIRRKDPVTWELLGNESFKRTQELFDAYVSSSVEAGHQKPSTPLKRIFSLLLGVLFLMVVAGITLWDAVTTWIGDDVPVVSKPVETKPAPVKSITISNGKVEAIELDEPAEQVTPKFESLGLQLDNFYIRSSGSLFEKHDLTVLAYKDTSFTVKELGMFNLTYESLGSKSGILTVKETNQQQVIFGMPEIPETRSFGESFEASIPNPFATK